MCGREGRERREAPETGAMELSLKKKVGSAQSEVRNVGFGRKIRSGRGDWRGPLDNRNCRSVSKTEDQSRPTLVSDVSSLMGQKQQLFSFFFFN